jgi:hypothetical protein
MEYTFKDDIDNMNKTPRFKFDITRPLPKGITDQINKPNKNKRKGEKTNRNFTEGATKIISFIKSFNPSAKGCRSPKKPTTLGPFLLCIVPITFLSTNVK